MDHKTAANRIMESIQSADACPICHAGGMFADIAKESAQHHGEDENEVRALHHALAIIFPMAVCHALCEGWTEKDAIAEAAIIESLDEFHRLVGFNIHVAYAHEVMQDDGRKH